MPRTQKKVEKHCPNECLFAFFFLRFLHDLVCKYVCLCTEKNYNLNILIVILHFLLASCVCVCVFERERKEGENTKIKT